MFTSPCQHHEDYLEDAKIIIFYLSLLDKYAFVAEIILSSLQIINWEVLQCILFSYGKCFTCVCNRYCSFYYSLDTIVRLKRYQVDDILLLKQVSLKNLETHVRKQHKFRIE